MVHYKKVFLLMMMMMSSVVDAHGSHINCAAKETAKVYPYVFGLNQTVTNKTNNFEDGSNGLVDVKIENSITDDTLKTFVALAATSKCYFDANECASQAGVA